MGEIFDNMKVFYVVFYQYYFSGKYWIVRLLRFVVYVKGAHVWEYI